jgi:hypothetical protein
MEIPSYRRPTTFPLPLRRWPPRFAIRYQLQMLLIYKEHLAEALSGQAVPWGALARLGLARSYAMQVENAKAKIGLSGFPHALERRRP